MRISIIISILLSAFLLSSCKSTHVNQSIKEKEITTSVDLTPIVNMVKTKEATIIDVRTDEEYTEGHIPNSVHIPLSTIAESLDKFKAYDKIVLVCGSGKRAAKAKAILNENGFNNVYNGMGWAELNELLK